MDHDFLNLSYEGYICKLLEDPDDIGSKEIIKNHNCTDINLYSDEKLEESPNINNECQKWTFKEEFWLYTISNGLSEEMDFSKIDGKFGGLNDKYNELRKNISIPWSKQEIKQLNEFNNYYKNQDINQNLRWETASEYITERRTKHKLKRTPLECYLKYIEIKN